MPTGKRMSEQQVRQKLIDAHTAFQHELTEVTAEFAKLLLSMGTKNPSDSGVLNLGNMPGAVTAKMERVTWLTAVIEFINQLGVFDPKKRSENMKQELLRRHALCVASISRSVAEAIIPLNDVQVLITRSVEKREIVHVGEKHRTRIGSAHARLMKDLAIVGFIQQFGVISSQAARNS